MHAEPCRYLLSNVVTRRSNFFYNNFHSPSGYSRNLPVQHELASGARIKENSGCFFRSPRRPYSLRAGPGSSQHGYEVQARYNQEQHFAAGHEGHRLQQRADQSADQIGALVGTYLPQAVLVQMRNGKWLPAMCYRLAELIEG